VVRLRFPDTEILGTLDWRGSWRNDRPTLATGVVEIPDDVTVSFTVRRIESVERSSGGSRTVTRIGDKVFSSTSGGWTSKGGGAEPIDLGFLRNLPADAIGSLTLGRGVVEESFPAVVHLSPALTHLYLGWTRFSDESLGSVSELDHLVWLQTWGNRFTDQGVQQLARLQRLESLYLEEESLTVAAFEVALALPRLKRLGVMDVPMTDAELALLRSRLPGVGVG